MLSTITYLKMKMKTKMKHLLSDFDQIFTLKPSSNKVYDWLRHHICNNFFQRYYRHIWQRSGLENWGDRFGYARAPFLISGAAKNAIMAKGPPQGWSGPVRQSPAIPTPAVAGVSSGRGPQRRPQSFFGRPIPASQPQQPRLASVVTRPTHPGSQGASPAIASSSPSAASTPSVSAASPAVRPKQRPTFPAADVRLQEHPELSVVVDRPGPSQPFALPSLPRPRQADSGKKGKLEMEKEKRQERKRKYPQEDKSIEEIGREVQGYHRMLNDKERKLREQRRHLYDLSHHITSMPNDSPLSFVYNERDPLNLDTQTPKMFRSEPRSVETQTEAGDRACICPHCHFHRESAAAAPGAASPAVADAGPSSVPSSSAATDGLFPVIAEMSSVSLLDEDLGAAASAYYNFYGDQKTEEKTGERMDDGEGSNQNWFKGDLDF